VNGRGNVVIRCVSVSVCVRLCAADRLITHVDNIIEISNASDSKFSKHFTGTVPTWPLKIFQKGGVARVSWPLNVWALNAYSSRMVKAMDLRFGVHVPRDSPDMTH